MTFTAENVDPFLCTHIMYAFGKVVGNTIDAYEWNDKGVGGKLARLNFVYVLIVFFICFIHIIYF